MPVEEEAKEEEAIVYGIPNNPELEQIYLQSSTVL